MWTSTIKSVIKIGIYNAGAERRVKNNREFESRYQKIIFKEQGSIWKLQVLGVGQEKLSIKRLL